MNRYTDEEKEKIKTKREAAERFVNFCAIVIGLCQQISLEAGDEIIKNNRIWMRTRPENIPSIIITKLNLEKMILENLKFSRKHVKTQIFHSEISQAENSDQS